jgi:hypothetical protein
MSKYKIQWWIILAVCLIVVSVPRAAHAQKDIYVSYTAGGDQASGTAAQPLKTLAAAISRLPERIDEDVTIHLAPGHYPASGIQTQNGQPLELNRAMCNGAIVRIIGNKTDYRTAASPGSVVLDWESDSDFLIMATQGSWALQDVQIGTRKPRQRGGISVGGPAMLRLRNVRIHTQGGPNGRGLHAHHGGTIEMQGAIELNEDMHEKGADPDGHCRITAEYFGLVRFTQLEQSSLSVGNGNLDARYYGIIEVRCAEAKITSWGYQSNPVAANNSGRVDFDGRTKAQICARDPRNTPIGLEQDGHVMAEGTRLVILGCDNANAVYLQKASTFFCNDIEIRGNVGRMLMASSGSTLLAGIVGDLGPVHATTGSTIIVEKYTGQLVGRVGADRGGSVVMPDSTVIQAAASTGGSDTAKLSGIHEAAFEGHVNTVRELLKEGADVNSRGPGGLTPLHMAAMGGHRQTSEVLLDNGADINAHDDKGRTAAQLAQAHGHNGLTEFLLSPQKAARK